jgi:hypothetical protein
MAIIVEGVKTDVLRRSAEEPISSLQLTESIEQTIRAHAMLLLFLEAKILGQQFADEKELSLVLQTWKQFATDNGWSPTWGWKEVSISHSRGSTVICGSSPGGDFVIGSIVSVRD